MKFDILPNYAFSSTLHSSANFRTVGDVETKTHAVSMSLQVVALGTTIANLGKAIGAEIKLGLQMHPFLVLTMAIMLQVATAMAEEAAEEAAAAATNLSFSNSPLSLLFCFDCNVEVLVPYLLRCTSHHLGCPFQLPSH